MPSRDWLWNLALAGVIVVPLSLMLLAVVTIHGPKEQPHGAGYQNPCYEAKTREERDLCQQFRMAESTSDLVGLTIWQVVGTGVEILLIAVAVGIATWAAWESRKAANAAEKTLVSSSRPWLSAEPEIASHFVFSEGSARVVIRVRMTNYGPSPAINVDVKCKILPIGIGMHEAKNAIVDHMRADLKRTLGQKIFPGKDFSYSVNEPLSREDIDLVTKTLWKNKNMRDITPVVVGCIAYRSPLGDDVFITEFMGNIFRKDPKNPGILLGIPLMKSGAVPIDELVLTTTYTAGVAD
jgi:hypothetical protein